jgi:hypothetical protein
VTFAKALRALRQGDTATVSHFLWDGRPPPEVPDPAQRSPSAKEMTAVRVPCSVCRHEQRALIDGLLALGTPLRQIAAGYGLSRSALHRHEQRHTPAFPAAEGARQIVEAESILPGLIKTFRYLSSMRSYGGGRRDELEKEALDLLWDDLTSILTDSPRDQLLERIAAVAFRLGVIFGHNQPGSDVEQAQAAVEDLESWGRDE